MRDSIYEGNVCMAFFEDDTRDQGSSYGDRKAVLLW